MPERIRNSSDLGVIVDMVPAEPTISTMIHENSRITIVRIAVATSESVFLIPHFARIDVSPAKKADSIAIISHIKIPPFLPSAKSIVPHIIINYNTLILAFYKVCHKTPSLYISTKICYLFYMKKTECASYSQGRLTA